MGFDGFSLFHVFFHQRIIFAAEDFAVFAADFAGRRANTGEANRAASIRQSALRVGFMIFLS